MTGMEGLPTPAVASAPDRSTWDLGFRVASVATVLS